MKILMVCLGNICRSPLAEGIMKRKVAEKGLDWTVDSRGTGGWHEGELPDSRSVKVAQKHGIDITDQRGEKLRPPDMENFDVIFAMDRSNFHDISDMAQTEEERQKVFMILNESYPGEDRSVPDPYYGAGDGFLRVYNMLDEACDAAIERLTK